MNQEILDENFQFQTTHFDKETIKKINLKKIDANSSIGNILGGRIAIIVAGGLSIIGAVIAISMDSQVATPTEILIEGAIAGGLYFICAFFVKKNPRIALIAGLVLYLIWILIYASIDISTLHSGIAFKIFIIYYLIKGISSTYKLEDQLAKLKSYGVPSEDFEYAKRLEEIPRTIGKHE